MDDLRKVTKGLECCAKQDQKTCFVNCPYYDEDEYDAPYTCKTNLCMDAFSLLKKQDTTMLQGFLTDIPSSESILNSVNCHAISLEHASQIIAICACACDLISPSGFISWLKDRIAQDAILKGCVEK